MLRSITEMVRVGI